MIRKIVRKRTLEDSTNSDDDLAYWLTRSPEERLAAVDRFRRLFIGSAVRIQRVARVIEQTRG